MANSQPAAVADYVDASQYSTLDQAITAAINGGHHGVYIPADTTVTALSSITIPDGLSIVGADPATSVVHFASLIASTGFVAKNATDITFSNFTITADASHPAIDWSNAATVKNSGLIDINGASHITVHGVTFTDAPGRGFYLNNVSDSVVSDNHTVGGGYTHISVSGNNNTVTGNDVNGGQWYGIELRGTDFTVSDNHITALTGSQSFGIDFQGLSNSTIKNNVIANVEHYGMYADGTATHDNAIIGNTISQMGIVNGVRVDESGTGIEIRGGAHDLLIANNTLLDELGYGIAVAGMAFAASGLPNGADAPHIVISGNSITGAWDPGIVVSGASYVTIRDNYVSSPHSIGLSIGDEHDNKALSTTHSDYAQIINNQFVNNWLEGIWATGISHATISGNEITDNNSYAGIYPNHQSAGITVISWPENLPSAYNWIVGNIITSDTGHELAGIYFAPNQGSNTVAFNDLSQNIVGGIVDQSGTATNVNSSNKMTVDGTELDNAPPLADAGAAHTIAAGAAIDLDGSASHFMSGTGVMSYHWSQIYGETVTIEDGNSAHAIFAAPDSNDTSLLGFRLTVWDANGSTTDDVYYAIDPSEHATAVSANPLTLNSLPGDPVFHGSAGNDMLQDNAGGKTIYGEGGDDWIAAGRGADHIDGGLGGDTVTYKDSDAGVTVDLNIAGAQTSGGWATGDVLTHVESLVGSKYTDVLVGDAGDNNLNGSGGNDFLLGGAGSDRLIGGTGADLMAGGTGDDVYYVDDPNDIVVEQVNEGFDSVRSTVSINHLADNVERLVLTGADPLNGTGNNLDNLIYGNDAANTLDGGEGNDQLYGYAGRDVLVGGAGADHLDGGAGTDVLIGGAGSDQFWFKKGEADGDTISDFDSNGELLNHSTGDRIFLQGYGAGASVTAGDNDTWHVDYAGGHDTITVHGIVHASDFHLV